MSDDEYEYEYDDDASMQEDDDNNNGGGGDDDDEDAFEYTDEEDEPETLQVELENLYYNAKGLRDSDVDEALKSFEQVIGREAAELSSSPTHDDATTTTNTTPKPLGGPWSFKALKQQIKLHLRAGTNAEQILTDYRRLLECSAHGDVSPNQIEKGINGMLERVASLYQGNLYNNNNNNSMDTQQPSKLDPQALALAVYDATLQTFHPQTGMSSQNDRLWFKTNIKYGQLLYEMNQTSKLQQVLQDLQNYGGNGTSSFSSSAQSSSSTQSMEIYALQIQLYSRQRDHKNLRQTFDKAMAVRGGIPHPRTIALIQELGGKMHMESKQYEAATTTFFQAFKSYDEAGDPARLKCLQYLVLASMLHASSINPFDSQEARPYRDDPQIVAMTNLVAAFQDSDISTFETILQSPPGQRMLQHDEFIRLHVTDLLRTIRTQVLQKVLVPYQNISLAALASHHLNNIRVEEVEALLVQLILDGTVRGRIDKVRGVLVLWDDKSRGSGKSGTSSTATAALTAHDYAVKQVEALQTLMNEMEQVSLQVTSTKIKDSGGNSSGGGGLLGTLSSSSASNIGAAAAASREMGFRHGMVH
mmetsp:Transcript_27503/g.75745  ORF Transcript_27503/g.75745 Transcript_27503/m.75745 type:complete len:587 (-) Transcript_27503:220-1980(-)